MKTILVTGGAGYVGSQSVLYFKELGWRVIVADDLTTGHREFAALADRFEQLDVCDGAALGAVLRSERVHGILHCAGRTCVPDPSVKPDTHFRGNVDNTLGVIEASREAG